MQRKQAIAQSKIIESLVLNREIKQAMKQRIHQEMLSTSLLVQRFLRRIRMKKQAALNRRNYIFDATIYLVVNKHDIKLKPTSRVEIFGQFTEQAPWSIKVPCVFDKHFQCFKADIRIKRGQLFKFVVENGRHYTTSKAYAKQRDGSGNENNVFKVNDLKIEDKHKLEYKKRRQNNEISRS